jgi:hypothetical protein
MESAWSVGIGLACAAQILITFPSGATSETPNPDTKMREWFRSLRQPRNGMSCCDISDCRYVDYRYIDNHYDIKIDNKWMTVPGEGVIHGTQNVTGKAVACYNKSNPYSDMITILCFVPPHTGS